MVWRCIKLLYLIVLDLFLLTEIHIVTHIFDQRVLIVNCNRLMILLLLIVLFAIVLFYGLYIDIIVLLRVFAVKENGISLIEVVVGVHFHHDTRLVNFLVVLLIMTSNLGV